MVGAIVVALELFSRETVEHVEVAGVFRKLFRHRLDGNGEIDQAAGDGAVRHAGETGAGRAFGLREDEAALFLDRLDAEDAIVAAARQDDADGVFAAILRERRRRKRRSALRSCEPGSVSRSRSRPSAMVRLALGGRT